MFKFIRGRTKKKTENEKKKHVGNSSDRKKNIGITCLSRNMFLTQFVWCFDFLADLK